MPTTSKDKQQMVKVEPDGDYSHLEQYFALKMEELERPEMFCCVFNNCNKVFSKACKQRQHQLTHLSTR
jgi:hypothetical protein